MYNKIKAKCFNVIEQAIVDKNSAYYDEYTRTRSHIGITSNFEFYVNYIFSDDTSNYFKASFVNAAKKVYSSGTQRFDDSFMYEIGSFAYSIADKKAKKRIIDNFASFANKHKGMSNTFDSFDDAIEKIRPYCSNAVSFFTTQTVYKAIIAAEFGSIN